MSISATEHKRTRVPGLVDGDIPIFNPPPVSGYKVWLAARLLRGFADGNAVGTWTDQSGNGHDAVQATDSKQPLYKVNIINGKATICFDGTDDEMTLGNIGGEFPTAATLFVVASLNSDVSYNIYTSHAFGESDIWWAFSGTGYFGPFHAPRYNAWPTGMPTTGVHMWVVKSATGTGTYEVIVDNASKGTQNTTHAGGTAHALGAAGAQARWLKGDIAEIIIYDTALSQGDIDSVEAYLNGLYAIY